MKERLAVQQLVSASRLRRRAKEITNSLLPPHVLPLLELRATAIPQPENLFLLAEKHTSVITLHADIISFTSMCSLASPLEVFNVISGVFNALDTLCREYGLAKIETIGDAYWCAHGLEAPATPADARKMVLFASAMRAAVSAFAIAGKPLAVRVGVHVGPVLGGIVGNRFPRYHLFGPHAKIAAALESNGVAHATAVSHAFKRLLLRGDDMQCCSGSKIARRNASKVAMSSSWNVHTWRALPLTHEDLEHDDSPGSGETPDEIGPVPVGCAAEWEEGIPEKTVLLKRHRDVEADVLEGLPHSVYVNVNPCWLVLDSELVVHEGGGIELGARPAQCMLPHQQLASVPAPYTSDTVAELLAQSGTRPEMRETV